MRVDSVRPLLRVEGRAYPLGLNNIDTDLIIPASYLKTITRAGLGAHAFEAIRSQPGNMFEDPAYKGAPILIAGENFGCGSSREHAAWALADMGIEAVIALSFSDIFLGNAVRNRIAAVVLPRQALDRLTEVALQQPIAVDLKQQMVTTPVQDGFAFLMDPFHRDMLIHGRDEIGVTLSREGRISEYEARIAIARGWQSLSR